MTYPHLKQAPADHNSPEFLQYLRDTNIVVFENDEWVFIENCKYHTPKTPHHTAFLKSNQGWTIMQDHQYHSLKSAMIMSNEIYSEWEMLIKASKHRSVKRYHVHFIKR